MFQDPNANNLVVSTTFYSERTRAMLCLVRLALIACCFRLQLIPLLLMINRHLTKDLMVEYVSVNDNNIMLSRLPEVYLVRPD